MKSKNQLPLTILCCVSTFFMACSSAPLSPQPTQQKSVLDRALSVIGLQTIQDQPAATNEGQSTEKKELQIPDFSKKDNEQEQANPQIKTGRVSIQELQKLRSQQTLHATLPVRILASKGLNTMHNGQALPLIVKVYKLKNIQSFQRLPLESFIDGDLDNTAIQTTKEIVLRPSQHMEYTEKLNPETSYVAVVGLFQRPGQNGWKRVFKTSELSATGLTILAGACSLEPLTTGTPAQTAILQSQASCAN